MKQVIKRVLIVTLYMGLILVSTNVYAKSAKAKEETVRLRKEPSTNSSIIELISQNEEVEILEETGDWYKVKYLKYTGYVRKDMLSVNNDKNENPEEKDNNIKPEEKPEEENNNNQSEQNNNNQSSEEPKEEDKDEQLEEQTEEDSNVQSEDKQNNEQQEQKPEEQETNMVQKGYSGNLKSKLDIKILPLINSSNIETINENTKFTITDIINKWCYVETENNSGWALISKVNVNEQNSKEEDNQEDKNNEETSENKDNEEQNKDNKNNQDNQNKEPEENKEIVKYVSAETLNVREKDDNNSKIISQLTLNTKVTVVEMVNSTWAKVTVKGKTGYVANKYLSDKKVDTSSRSEGIKREESKKSEEEKNEAKENSEQKQEEQNSNQSNTSNSGLTGESVVAFAKKYLGYKYVSGGASPSTGFDCSGFTSYVYKNFGINLSRTSGAQASNGVAVSKSNLKAGDLVIFNNSSNTAIGHVGIYIGGNTFIHAANAKKGVITTSLSDSYYTKTYVTARRVIN